MRSLEMARDKEEGVIVLCSPVAAIMLDRLENRALGFMESSATPCALASDLAEFLIRRDRLGMWLCSIFFRVMTRLSPLLGSDLV